MVISFKHVQKIRNVMWKKISLAQVNFLMQDKKKIKCVKIATKCEVSTDLIFYPKTAVKFFELSFCKKLSRNSHYTKLSLAKKKFN